MLSKKNVVTFFRIAMILVLALCLASPTTVARAGDITLAVDTGLDSNAPAYQACTTTPNDCSLRGAISKANADPANTYTINLPARTYTLSIPGKNESANATGDLDIWVDLNINGAGAVTTVIDANHIDRALYIHTGTVVIDGVTITNGEAYFGSDGSNGSDASSGNPGQPPENGADGGVGGVGADGGGIYNIGALTLTHCIVTANSAGRGGNGGQGGKGGDTSYIEPQTGGNGGIGGQSGSGGQGGGIYNDFSLVMENCTVNNNYAGQSGHGGQGGDGGISGGGTFTGGRGGNGGIANFGGNGGGIGNQHTLTLRETTVSGNHAGNGNYGGSGGAGGFGSTYIGGGGGEGGMSGYGGEGGGIFSGYRLDITDSTISNNYSGSALPAGNGGAGGVGYLGGGGGSGSGGFTGGRGGGIMNIGVLQLNHSFVVGNHAGNGSTGGNGGNGGSGGSGVGNGGAAGYAGDAGSGGDGGGVYSSNPMTITLSAIQANYAGQGGLGGAGGAGGSSTLPPSHGDGALGKPGGMGGRGGDGGGISVDDSSANVAFCSISDNHAGDGGIGGAGGHGGDGGSAGQSGEGGAGGRGGQSGGGGGILARGTLIIKGSTASGNQAGNAGDGGAGGAGGNGAETGVLIPGGVGGNGGEGGVGVGGGAVLVRTNYHLVLNLSTLSGNQTGMGGDGGAGGAGGSGSGGAPAGSGGNGGNGGMGGYGGGLQNYGSSGLSHNTITGSATGGYSLGGGGGPGGGDGGSSGEDGSPGLGGTGGGISHMYGTVALKNNIIALNTDYNQCPDIYGPLSSFGYNLVGDRGTQTFLPAPGDQVGVPASPIDPRMDALADNGGKTQTHALKTNSPAVEAGICTDLSGSVLTTDQRGLPRLVDLPGKPNLAAGCDIGAYELQPQFAVLKTADDCSPDPGQTITYTIMITNTGPVSATNAALVDHISADLDYLGPVTLNPPGAGTVSSPPNLVSGLTITNGTKIMLSFPVTVKPDLASGTLISNTASITSLEVSVPTTGTVEVRVNYRVYLPVVLR